MVTLYDNIKSLCEERDTTVSAMCETVGISKSTLSNLKNGRSETISANTARKIASFLNVPVDEVLHGQKEKPAVPKNNGLDKERAEWATAWENATPEQRRYALAVLTLRAPPAEG